MKASTLAELLVQRTHAAASTEAYREFETVTGTWVCLTWCEFAGTEAGLAGLRAGIRD